MAGQDVEVTRQFVERFLGGDLAGTLALLHPEMVLNEGAGLAGAVTTSARRGSRRWWRPCSAPSNRRSGPTISSTPGTWWSSRIFYKPSLCPGRWVGGHVIVCAAGRG
jgi:hypothetical protein